MRTCADLLRRCEAQQAQLKKVYKLADTAEERYGKYASANPRVRTQLDLLKGECKKTDEIFSEYSKASKYGKDVDGKPITSAYLGALLGGRAIEQSGAMLENMFLGTCFSFLI